MKIKSEHKKSHPSQKKQIAPSFALVGAGIVLIIIIIAAVLAIGVFENNSKEKNEVPSSPSLLTNPPAEEPPVLAIVPQPGKIIVEFTKTNYGNEEDCITQNVCITRGKTQGIFNSKKESSYSNTSPKDTEWFFGSECKEGLTFKLWVDAVKHNPQGSVNVPACLHLINDNLYFNIKFTSFSGGNNGGGFSYTRKQFASFE